MPKISQNYFNSHKPIVIEKHKLIGIELVNRRFFRTVQLRDDYIFLDVIKNCTFSDYLRKHFLIKVQLADKEYKYTEMFL